MLFQWLNERIDSIEMKKEELDPELDSELDAELKRRTKSEFNTFAL